jgi:hypothetical protein
LSVEFRSKKNKKKFPNIKKLIKVNFLKNSLKNNSYDIVHSNATIEYVGSFHNQLKFIYECKRISKKYVFIQTPNRFFPLDLHTFLPLIHWLPKKIHRIILKKLGFNFYSKEKNLNLLSKNDLKKVCDRLSIKKYKIIEYDFLFFIFNLILIIKKN